MNRRYVEGSSQLTPDDILIVAPSNLQVQLLASRLGEDAREGTIDMLQGQEAPAVIVSMKASAGDDSPRGIDFPFDKNRLNVALSRAQSLAIVVGNPGLVRTACRTVKSMGLVNLSCRAVGTGRFVEPRSASETATNPNQ